MQMGPWDHAYREDMDEIPNENDMDENDKQDEKPIRRIEKELLETLIKPYKWLQWDDSWMFKRHMDEIETIMWVNLNHVNEILLQ